jgi:uncharacterized membrane protein YhaH (DUF805 family)
MVGFGEAIKRAFAGWSTWEGRATRAEYWWWFLFVWLLSFIPYIGILTSLDWSTSSDGTLEGSSGGGVSPLWTVLFLILWLAFILPSIAVSVRRLHDTDRSGWWYWIALVPCIGGIWYLVLMVLPSTPGPNKYGAPSTP